MADEKQKNTLENQESLSFEEALSQLEQVVKQLESGDLSLDQSLQAFQEGSELARLCRLKLDEVEQSIQKLIVAPNGETVEADFPEMDDA